MAQRKTFFINTLGLFAKALAIDTLCCSPPESSLGYLCSFSPSPTASMTVL